MNFKRFAFLFTFALLLPVGSLRAQSNESSVLPQPSGNLLFGQKHAYTLVFRNDGAATILGRIVFKNTDKEPIAKLTLTIPNITVTDPIFYQVITQDQCIEYAPLSAEPSSSTTIDIPCLKYSQDYLYNNFEYFGNEEYVKVAPGLEGETFTIPLSSPVAPDQAGGIVFAYRSKNYTKETWAGGFHFSFTSPTIQSPIFLLRVAVGVDSDLYLKGNRSKVAYKEEAPAVADMTASSIGRAIDYYQRQGFTKEGQNLGSGESLVVTGLYADAWWRLYPTAILATLVGLVAVILLWMLWRRHYHPARQVAGPYTGIFTPKNVGLSFLSAMATFGVVYLSQSVQSFRYGDQVSGTLFTLIFVGLYLIAIFGPAAWTGFTHGWRHALFIFMVELLFLAVLLVIYINIVPKSEIFPLPYATPETGSTRFLE